MVVELGRVVVEQALDVVGRRRRRRCGAADAGQEVVVEGGIAAARSRLRVGQGCLVEAAHLAQQAAALAPHLGQARVGGHHPVVGGERLLLQAHAGQGDGADAEGVDVARLGGEDGVGGGDRLDRPVHPEARGAEIEQGRRPPGHGLERSDEGALGVLETPRLEGRQALEEQPPGRLEGRLGRCAWGTLVP